MIKYYQELLNECIDIQEHNKILHILKQLNQIMKYERGEKMMRMGKHTSEGQKIKQLEETVALRDKEIKDIKTSLADVLLDIRNINEMNDYNDPSVKRRKISEICTDVRYQLLVDEIEGTDKKAKIIELPNTNQSKK